jgi:AraC-like DNA-binding protein
MSLDMDKTLIPARATLYRQRPPSPIAPTPEPLYSVHQLATFDPREARRMRHTCHSLSLALDGRGLFRTGPLELPALRPLLIFRPAGDEALIALDGPSASWYVGFHWPRLSCRRIGLELDLSWGGRSLRVPRAKPLAAAAVPRVVELYAGLRTVLQRQGLVEEARARALMLELFASYVELPSGLDATLASRSVSRFHDLLTARACSSDSIESIASAAGASASHLRDRFRSHFGTRPVAYRNALRLARARDLFATTAMKVNEVARATGFSDPLYFSRAFRRRFGISPREMIQHFKRMQ